MGKTSIQETGEIIHLAGPYRDFLQKCSRCGAVLIDYRNASWPEEQGAPKGWREGALIAVDVSGSGSWVVREPDAIATCAGARA